MSQAVKIMWRHGQARRDILFMLREKFIFGGTSNCVFRLYFPRSCWQTEGGGTNVNNHILDNVMQVAGNISPLSVVVILLVTLVGAYDRPVQRRLDCGQEAVVSVVCSQN